MTKSLYDVLLVNQNATLDEIKLAFKRRALQVHPDKGGSKEEFHLVYQALETLGDPAARKKYDHGIGTLPSKQSPPTHSKKKSFSKFCNPSRSQGGSKSQQVPSKSEKTAGFKGKQRADEGTGSAQSVPQPSRCKQTELLIMIRDLLKDLPRHVRNDVFGKQFSQKQRLILEKWMAENSSKPAAQSLQPLPSVEAKASHERDNDIDDRNCLPLALPTSAGFRQKMLKDSGSKQEKKTQQKRSKRMCGQIHKKSTINPLSCYSSGIGFDAVEIRTGCFDLQTALENLVILMAVKQKMRDNNSCSSFEERLQDALTTSAKEQGKECRDLNLRYLVVQSAGGLVGPGIVLRSPEVRSIEVLGRLRSYLAPFRIFANKARRGNIFQWHSPLEVQNAWHRFQVAIYDAWKAAGTDGTAYVQRIRNLHEANLGALSKHLQAWEIRHMALDDKNQYRPSRLRDRSTKQAECKERQQMARHDKNRHRPKALREKNDAECMEKREREQMAMHDKNKHRPKRLRIPLHKRLVHDRLVRNLSMLKRLLATWDRALQREARLAETERRKCSRQRMKDSKDRKRQEFLKRKRLQNEERLRRCELQKRMKSNDSEKT